MTRYEFTEAAKVLDQWESPKYIADELRNAALNLSIQDHDILEENIFNMQRWVLSVCEVLDAIKEKGYER